MIVREIIDCFRTYWHLTHNLNLNHHTPPPKKKKRKKTERKKMVQLE